MASLDRPIVDNVITGPGYDYVDPSLHRDINLGTRDQYLMDRDYDLHRRGKLSKKDYKRMYGHKKDKGIHHHHGGHLGLDRTGYDNYGYGRIVEPAYGMGGGGMLGGLERGLGMGGGMGGMGMGMGMMGGRGPIDEGRFLKLPHYERINENPNIDNATLWRPRADIFDVDQDHLRVEFELPGVPREDISLTIQDNILTLAALKPQTRKEEVGFHYQNERHFGKFYRRMMLPFAVDANKIKAHMDNGVLKVHLIRLPGVSGGRIPIGEGLLGQQTMGQQTMGQQTLGSTTAPLGTSNLSSGTTPLTTTGASTGRI